MGLHFVKKLPERRLGLFILFFILWLLLAGEVDLHVCLWGAAASFLMHWFCVRVLDFRWRPRLGELKKLGAVLGYLGYLLAEMLKAGFVVMRLIYTRGREMEPELIRFDTTLCGDRARAALANSITLTAGTITVEAADGRFCVHTLDRSLAEGIENSEFQRRLERLEE